MMEAFVRGTVVVVDDTETCGLTLEVALSGIPGVEVVFASSASEALRLLRDRTRTVRAVITDLHMPRLDGFELIRLIRADGRYRAVPIIVTSGDTDPATPERTAQLGADAYFPKPYSPALVRRKLEQLLNEARPLAS